MAVTPEQAAHALDRQVKRRRDECLIDIAHFGVLQPDPVVGAAQLTDDDLLVQVLEAGIESFFREQADQAVELLFEGKPIQLDGIGVGHAIGDPIEERLDLLLGHADLDLVRRAGVRLDS